MSSSVDQLIPLELSRRDVVRGGVVTAAGLILTGCASGARRTGYGTPGPVWPDQQPPATASANPKYVPANVPAPANVSPPPAQPMSHFTGAPGYYGLASGVIPRSYWTNALPVRSRADDMQGIQAITIHHDSLPSTTLRRQDECAQRLEAIRRRHVSEERWADIGYHFIIDPSGRVWEGRPLWLQGAHVKDHNPHNMGIMVMGNFDEHRPTSEALDALERFTAAQMHRYRVPLGRIYTHQELMPTACPGRNLQRFMIASRSTAGGLARA